MYCHHCGTRIGALFENTAPVLAVGGVQPVYTRARRAAGFFNSDASKLLIAVFAPAGLGSVLAWLNGWRPGVGALVATVIVALLVSGLFLLRWYFERPVQPELPKPGAITVTLHEPLASGWRTYLDLFEDPSITVDDLRLVADRVLSPGCNFSREAMVRGGLSQPKARKIQGEFLRLNYAVPLPNGKPGYFLTLRGRKVLVSLLPGNS